MDWSSISLLEALVVFVAGVGAGFVNSMAGGGSLMAIAALLFMGIPSPIANATNRVAIVLQNSVSTYRYRRAGRLDFSTFRGAVIPAAFGAVVGTFTAVEISERVFDIALACVLVLVVVTVFLPKPRPRDESSSFFTGPVGSVFLFFLIGIYGGFVQSGVGFLLIALIRFTREFDLIEANAFKVSIVVVFGAISLAIFAYRGMVVWSVGLLLAAGTMVGAWIGVHAAISRGAGFVRVVIVASALLAGLRLLGFL